MKRSHSDKEDSNRQNHTFAYHCNFCSYITYNIQQYSQHCQQEHHNNCLINENLQSQSSIENDGNEEEEPFEEELVKSKKYKRIDKDLYKIKTWNYKGGHKDLHTTLDNLKNTMKDSLLKFINEKNSVPAIKYSITVNVEFGRLLDVQQRVWTTQNIYFNSKFQIIYNLGMDFDETYNQSVAQIWKNCDTFIQNGSGWVFRRIYQVKLSIFRFQHFKSY